MDFIMSKVCMAISALVVLGVLSGLLACDPAHVPAGELDGLLNGLCGSVDVLAGSGASGEFTWEVPSLSSGERIDVVVIGGWVMAESSGWHAAARASVPLRTWTWSGEAMNESELERLDADEEPLSATSGAILRVAALAVQVSGLERIAVFVSIAA